MNHLKPPSGDGKIYLFKIKTADWFSYAMFLFIQDFWSIYQGYTQGPLWALWEIIF